MNNLHFIFLKVSENTGHPFKMKRWLIYSFIVSVKASLLSLLAPACPLQVGAAASPKEQGQESEAPPTPSASLLCAGVVWLWICHASTCCCRVCRQRRWWTQADPYAPTQQGRQGDSLQRKAWGTFSWSQSPSNLGIHADTALEAAQDLDWNPPRL